MSAPLAACEGEADLVEDPDTLLILDSDLEYGRCPCANINEHNSGLRLVGVSDEPAIAEYFV